MMPLGLASHWSKRRATTVTRDNSIITISYGGGDRNLQQHIYAFHHLVYDVVRTYIFQVFTHIHLLTEGEKPRSGQNQRIKNVLKAFFLCLS